MSILVPINGVNYIIPTPGEVGWGSNLDAFFVAIGAGVLQKNGGNFTLSAPVNFGPSFGILASKFSSQNANTATSGLFNLAHGDAIDWRNNANSADLPLGVNSSDQLTFNGVPIGGSGIFTAGKAVITDGSGNLTTATTTATEIGYVAGVTSAIQTQLNSKATSANPVFTGTVLVAPGTLGTLSLAFSDHTTTGFYESTANQFTIAANGVVAASFNGVYVQSVLPHYFADGSATVPSITFGTNTNTGLYNLGSGAMAITTNGVEAMSVNAAQKVTFLGAIGTPLTASRAVTTDGSSQLSVSATTSTELGFVSGVTSAIQTQLNAKATDSLVVHLAGTETITGNKSISVSSGIGLTFLNQSSIAFADSGSAHELIFFAPSSLTTNVTYLLPASPPAVNGAVMSSTTGGTMSWTSTLAVANGGTGDSTLAAHGILIGNGTGAITVSTAGASGQVLTSNGASADPTFQNVAGTGTVNSGTQFQLAYYATSTTAVSGLTLITASRALASNANGLPVASATTATELGFVSGVTSAIQTQLNAKAPLASPTFTGTLTAPNATLTDVSNQLTLGTTRTVTITAPTPATASRTWTIPDIGGNGTFAALEAAQTFTALNTFTSSSGLTVSNNQNAKTKLTVSNTNNTSGAAAILQLTGGGSSSIGAYINFDTTSHPWSAGVAEGSSGAWILENSDDLSGGTQYIIASRTAGVSILGTTTNDNAAGGFVGQYVSSTAAATNFPATTTYGDLTSISLTAGDWDVTGQVFQVPNGSTTTTFIGGISVNSGNSATGLNGGDTSQTQAAATAVSNASVTIANVRMSLSTTTTVYLKYSATFSAGTPQALGRISARRMR